MARSIALRGRATDHQLVEATAETTFDLAKRLERLPRWHPFFFDVSGVPALLGAPGATFDATIKLAGQRLEVRYEVVVFDPPWNLTLVGRPTIGGWLRWSRRFEPAEHGTLVNGELEFELPGSFAPTPAEQVFTRWAIERDMRHSLEYFAAEVHVAAGRSGPAE